MIKINIIRGDSPPPALGIEIRQEAEWLEGRHKLSWELEQPDGSILAGGDIIRVAYIKPREATDDED